MIRSGPPRTVSIDEMLRHHPDFLFLVDAHGRILQYLGGPDAGLYATPEVFLGRPIHDVLPAPAASRLVEALSRVSFENDPVVVDYSLPMPGGERFYEARLVPIEFDRILAICRGCHRAPPSARAATGFRTATGRGRACRPRRNLALGDVNEPLHVVCRRLSDLWFDARPVRWDVRLIPYSRAFRRRIGGA